MLAGHMVRQGNIELVELPERTLEGPGEIIFQPEVACLCGSDILFFGWSEFWRDPRCTVMAVERAETIV